MTHRELAADVLTTALDRDALDPTDVLAGTPQASSAGLAQLGGTDIGIWQLTQGQVTDTEVDEVFIVLSGRGEVAFQDGTSIALAPGVAVRLRAGERTTWTITETLRKIYIIETDHA